MTNNKSFHCINFGSSGDKDTLAECMQNFVQFVMIYGKKEQWDEDPIPEMNEDLWTAAVKLWGLPSWSPIV